MNITLGTLESINYRSISLVADQVQALNLSTQDLAPALNYAYQLSSTKAYRFARGTLSLVNTEARYESDAQALIQWGKGGTSGQRQLVAKALRLDGGKAANIFLIHNISEMTQPEARAYMSDYFASGGDLDAVSDWLSIAGGVLRRHQVKDVNTAGNVIRDVVDWVVDRVEDVVDSITQAITAIVDAVISAGRALVDIVADVINWAADAIGDLVQALIEAGQSVADILQAAWDYGVAGVRRFVRALIDIGRTIGDVLLFAVQQAASVLETFVDALIRAGQSVGRVLQWIAGQAVAIGRQVVQSLLDLGRSVANLLNSAFWMGVSIVRSVVRALVAAGQTVGTLLVTAITRPASLFQAVVQALNELGQTIAQLFDEVKDAVADGVRRMTQALLAIGKTIIEVVAWAVNQTAGIITDVLQAMISAGKTVMNIIGALVGSTIAVIKKIVQGLFDIGRTVLELLEFVALTSVEFLRDFFTALTELVGGLARFAGEVVRLTYRGAALLVESLLNAGLTVAELLATMVGQSYWAFRRIINGILQNSGTIGQILDWALTQAEDFASNLWNDTLQAIRFAGESLVDAIEWAANVSEEAVTAILNAWETIENNLIDFYAAAANLSQQGIDDIFRWIGRATVRLENSVTYVLNYLENDFVPGIQDFISGLLDAGYELAELLVNLTNLAGQALAEAITAILDYGITLADLIANTIQNPGNFLPNLLAAAQEAGQTLEDIYRAVIIDLNEQYLEEVIQTWEDLQTPINDILVAIAEVATGAIATAVSILLSNLASYRAMTPPEIAQATLIYGNSFDYSRIFFSQESLSNDIIFGLQDWFNQNPNSRAFVTNTLVNFDVNDGPIDLPTMIHELCHVWQFENTGPFYMVEAIHAQVWGAGYSYGYDSTAAGQRDGTGGADDLVDAINNNPGLTTEEVFELFNREQQAEIIMHYYVRRYIDGLAPAAYQPWQPFQSVVFS